MDVMVECVDVQVVDGVSWLVCCGVAGVCACMLRGVHTASCAANVKKRIVIIPFLAVNSC